MSVSIKTVNFFFIIVFVIALLGTEVWLRINGTRPGFIYSGVEEVDSLEVMPCYFTDLNGIQKISPYGVQHINDYVSGKKKITVEQVKADKLENDLSSVAFDFYCLQHRLSGGQCELLRDTLGISSNEDERSTKITAYDQSEFRKRIIAAQVAKQPTAFDSLLLQYLFSPINSSGFRSISFSARIKNKRKILLLGNSFTWGKDGIPCFNSFAEILLSRGYLVYNTGIVSTDPVHYVSVMKAYMDSIQPDIVIVNFSVNDKMHYKHAATEIYHHTNAGLLSAYPNNTYINAREAYELELELSKIPSTNLFNKFCSTTAITTRFWCFALQKNWVTYYSYKAEAYKKRGIPNEEFPVGGLYVDQVRELCRIKNIPCIVSAIPDIYHYYERYPELTYKEVFRATPFFEIQTLSREDYSTYPGDDHLNNSGHKKYADFLQQLIDSVQATLP